MNQDGCSAVGDLAAGFVVGALTPDEDRLVRYHLETCDRPHPELAQLRGVVPYLVQSVEQIEPPPALKSRILAAAAAEPRLSMASGSSSFQSAPGADASGRTTAAAAGTVTRFPSAEERLERRSRKTGPLPWLAGIAAALAIALGGWNLTLQRDLAIAREYQAGLSAVLDLAAGPGARTATLRPEGGSGPTGIAAVSQDGRLAIVMRGLPATTGPQVYEAWLIGSDGSPVPVGGFAVGDSGTATFTTTQGAAVLEPGVTVALTKEPARGATTPTLPIVAAGQAVAPES